MNREDVLDGVSSRYQVVNEGRTQDSSNSADHVNGLVRGAKIGLIDLDSGRPVAPDCENGHKDADDHETYAEGERDAGLMRLEIFESEKLAQRNSKLCDHESEDDHADTGAYPGEERAFVGQVVAGA